MTMTSAPRRVLKQHWGKLLLAGAGVVVIAVIVVLALVAPRWPFREGALKQRLEMELHGKAQFAHFHEVFFPHPGAVIDGLVLTPHDSSKPKITAKRLTIHGLYWGLLGTPKHLKSMSFDGLEVSFPGKQEKSEAKAQGTGGDGASNGASDGASKDDTRYDEVDAKDSRVVFAGKEGHPARVYEIYQLVLKNFSITGPMHFSSSLKIPTPEANVEVSGVFGPVDPHKLMEAPLAGKFTMKDANLATFQALYGTVTANGTFQGKLGQLKVDGGTETPDFGVKETAHALPLKTTFTVTVDGTSGDVQFNEVHAVLGKTKMLASGQLAKGADKKRTLTLNLSSEDAQIGDLMYLFVQKKSPLAGPTQFKMQVKLPSGKEPFEKRVEMTAHFGIENSKFTHRSTEEKLSQLSEKARGNPKDENPALVVTNLAGDVALKDGIANFSRLDGEVPGASAKLRGTYNLQSHAVDLHGTLETKVKLSKATTGFKALVMKIIETVKNDNQRGATVPVRITGTYEKPNFSVDAPAEK